jgi:AhpD family alkylhydroperoxidase
MTTSDTPASTRARIELRAAAPDAYRAMLELERSVRATGLEPRISELVKVRASQLNGCAYCLDMHARAAREAGEEQRRLDVLSAWREVPWFSEREQAALALTEALTRVGEAGVPDEVYAAAAEVFDAAELGALLFTVVTINAWNRIAVSTHMTP